ncbi:MAG TPA: glycosyltransferase [Candidatus Binataceae bacterium]|nr:glycosyltransferase [Candidatus Binataceae bacterium]
MDPKIRLLSIGHSHVVALNRSIFRELGYDRSYEITVASPAEYHSELGIIEVQPEAAGSPLALVRLATRRKGSVFIFGYDWRSLVRLIRDGNYDLIHAWEEPYIYAGYEIARAVAVAAGEQTAFCFRTAQSLPKRYFPPFGYFERTCVERADGWIAGGQLVFEALVRHGYPAERGRILSLAVDTGAFTPLDAGARALVRKELGLESPILGYVGRLSAPKGIDVMLKAIERLDSRRSWSLLVLGAGPLEKTIVQWARSRGWENRVRVMLVPHRDVPRYLATMDLLIAPSLTTRSWKEQFGRMVIEAFACGVPVISSNSGELPYVIGDAGWIVPEGEPGALTRAIEEGLDNPEHTANIARIGLKRAQNYSAQTLAKQFDEYYRSLIEQKLRSQTPRQTAQK